MNEVGKLSKLSISMIIKTNIHGDSGGVITVYMNEYSISLAVHFGLILGLQMDLTT